MAFKETTIMAFKSKVRTEYSPRVVAFAQGLLRRLGWKVLGQRPPEKRLVITAVPHTTNWDLPYMLLASMALNIPAVFTMKDFWFFWPLGPIMRWLGGIPINRRERTNLVDQVVSAFEQYDTMNLVIPPEGTRKDVQYWKTGYYWIARGAGASVLPAFINYETKETGVADEAFALTGDFEADFERMANFYEGKLGIRPAYDPARLPEAEIASRKAS